MSWQNRIVGHGEEAPDQLLANPKNWRIHPATQEAALVATLDMVGVVQGVIVNRSTGHVVDGHLRVALAIRREEPSIPVTYVELTEAEEALVLATFDPLTELVTTDHQKLGELFDVLEADARVVAEAVHGEPLPAAKTVEFEAQVRYRVVVDCDGPDEQAALAARLKAEGYACRAS